ncbi:MAG: peptidylprolyl isomerase [Planctomycetota bacterium]
MPHPVRGGSLLLAFALVSCHSGESVSPRREDPPPSSREAASPAVPRPSWLEENPDGSGLAPSSHGPDDVVAVVDAESLTMQQLVDNALEWWGDKTLDEMIFRSLMEQYVRRVGIAVSEEELSQRADHWLKALDQGIVGSSNGKSSLADVLAAQGETFDGYKGKLVADENFRRQLLLELIVTYDLVVQERVEVQHILVETQEQAKAVLEKLAMKAEFARLAQDESLDMRSGQNGGRLAPFVMGMGPYGAEFDRVAFSLAPGEVSQPFADPRRGVHVIRCISKTPARQAAWEEARAEVWASVLQAPPTEDDIAHWIVRTKELAKDKVDVRWRFGVEEPDK